MMKTLQGMPSIMYSSKMVAVALAVPGVLVFHRTGFTPELLRVSSKQDRLYWPEAHSSWDPPAVLFRPLPSISIMVLSSITT